MKRVESIVRTDDGVSLHVVCKGDGRRPVIVPNAVYLADEFDALLGDRTLAFFDTRNRGRSDRVTDPIRLRAGIHHDVDDLEAVRRALAFEQVDLIGWSYLGLMVALYAMKYPQRVGRFVQLAPIQPHLATQYPSDLCNHDAVYHGVMAALAQMQSKPSSSDPVENCRLAWDTLRPLYVARPEHVAMLSGWGFCEMETERHSSRHFIGTILPSIGALELQLNDFASATMPALVIHGTKDRSAPFGGGQDWARRLPNARLLRLEDVGHVAWMEAPGPTFAALEKFLSGAWPVGAERVE